jgi:hypothetical protein
MCCSATPACSSIKSSDCAVLLLLRCFLAFRLNRAASSYAQIQLIICYSSLTRVDACVLGNNQYTLGANTLVQLRCTALKNKHTLLVNARLLLRVSHERRLQLCSFLSILYLPKHVPNFFGRFEIRLLVRTTRPGLDNITNHIT